MKFSLIPHLLELPREAKVTICSALFFALCLGGWAVSKAPLNDCPKTAQSENEHEPQKVDPTPAPELKFIRWKQQQENKKFCKQISVELSTGTNPNPVPPPEPAEPSETVKPVEQPETTETAKPAKSAAPSDPGRLSENETLNSRLASRGERIGTVIKGSASFYGGGDGLDGCPTASGEIFDASALTAAHRELPFGTRVKVTCLNTGKSVVVRINDRGPFNCNLILDLSRAAAEEIGLTSYGIGPVEIEILN